MCRQMGVSRRKGETIMEGERMRNIISLAFYSELREPCSGDSVCLGNVGVCQS